MSMTSHEVNVQKHKPTFLATNHLEIVWDEFCNSEECYSNPVRTAPTFLGTFFVLGKCVGWFLQWLRVGLACCCKRLWRLGRVRFKIMFYLRSVSREMWVGALLCACSGLGCVSLNVCHCVDGLRWLRRR